MKPYEASINEEKRPNLEMAQIVKAAVFETDCDWKMQEDQDLHCVCTQIIMWLSTLERTRTRTKVIEA